MVEAFQSLVGTGLPFNQSRLNDEQKKARELLALRLESIFQVNCRGRFLRDLQLCVTGYDEADRDEDVNVTTFSALAYFKMFTEELVSYADKVDFLLLCVHAWYCQIRPHCVGPFVRVLDDLLAPLDETNSITGPVLDMSVARTPRLPGHADPEEKKQWLSNFVNKENWPLYSQELSRLQAEQEVCERERRLAGTVPVFGWKPGPDAPVPYSDRARAMRVILLGPPGAGKTTQALSLAQQYNLLHVPVGPLLHEFAMAEEGTEDAGACAEALQHGQLVDDRIVWPLVRSQLLSKQAINGWVLDGFPRNKAQAELLEMHLTALYQPLTAVLNFEVPANDVTDRLQGRLYHKPSLRPYHVTDRPPQEKGLDDWTQEPLLKRQDDEPVILQVRLEEFFEHTKGLAAHYKAKGLLYNLDGTRDVKAILNDVRRALREAYHPPTGKGEDGVNVILLGGPGSGKGTQALRLKAERGLVHLCPGDLLTAEVAQGTPLGRQIAGVLAGGQQRSPTKEVEDLLLEVLRNKLKAPDSIRGFVLDGFPTTISLLQKLEKVLAELRITVHACINLHLESDQLMRRCQGRLLHVTSGRQYHRTLCSPKTKWVDDITGEDLVPLSEEPRQVLLEKLAKYHEQSAPILRHFERQGRLFTVDGRGAVDDVASDVEEMVTRARHLISE
mmetsp:Transcript_13045/g.23473  ORF Transcript_13045/g.23473 Transcript_13045/m.23473 type:complete len:671 (-) Transcript_13045:461-2473(-)